MTAVQPAPHPARAPSPLRRRVAAALTSAALVLAGLTLAPVAPASATTPVTDLSSLAAAFYAGGTVTVILDDGFDTTAGQGPIAVPAGGNVTLDLNGQTLTVTGGVAFAGIGVPAGASLTISDSRGGGTVTAIGDGDGAGIGGGLAQAGGSVTVTGGTVTAFGGFNGAGIGGGYLGAGGSVSVTGGTVTATGGLYGAGIGGGYLGAGGSVSVTGGTVTATGGDSGAGIGGGFAQAGGSVSIGPDGHVTALGWARTPTFVIGAGSGAGSSSDGFGSLSNAGTLTIPAGNTLTIPAGSTVNNSGTINVDGEIANAGSIINTGTITPETSVTDNNYVVTFDPADPPTAATTQRVFASSLTAAQITLPSAGRTGHNFTGWHTAATGGTPWNADTPLTANLTVYAQWTLNTHTVTFDSDGGSTVAPVSTDYNTPITEPTAPTRAGHIFTGWYAPAATDAFVFSTPITANLTLTARWAVVAPPLLTPSNATPAQTLTAGNPVIVTGTGFAAGQELQVWLHSDPVRLGTLTADADGAVTGQFTVPANTPAGVHHIVLVEANGTEHRSSGPITVTAETPATPTPTPTPTVPTPTTPPGTPAPAVPTGLAATGTSPAWPLGLATALLLAGLALATRRTHRNEARSR